ncbi:MAG: riboflavin kinase [Bacteroidales bacterium]|jgi:riboflavin kinase/FMN adenylyltransferase|nr:riboflavin kinase [Bacteroidales bacterium]
MAHTFHYSGFVIEGLQNGRKWGFPTANILPQLSSATPDIGVYAVQIQIDNKNYQGMMYVGIRPTINLSQLTIEINIFDFNASIYGQYVEFEIVKKIREDRKFDSVTQLIKQIQKDKDEILQIFAQ